MTTLPIIKVFFPAIVAFIAGIVLASPWARFLYRNKLWKKQSVRVAVDGGEATISQSIHKDEERKVPRMGGVVIWLSAGGTAVLFWILAKFFPGTVFEKLDFVSRNQTWIPLFTLLAGSLVGLIDDFLETRGNGDHAAGGLSLKKRLLAVSLIALSCALWFYWKLGVYAISIPIAGAIDISWSFIPLFVIVAIAIYSGGVIDGIDGLSGGIFAAIFSAYAGIAYFQDQVNLAAFCAAVVGGLLAFLWFNIPPARFYMSETGIMGLTITLTVVAFMTDTLGEGEGLIVLPIIALPLLVASGSSLIQVLSKRFRGKKVFLVAPLHHHFQALGWPGYKVTMRFWVVGVVFALLGLVIALAS